MLRNAAQRPNNNANPSELSNKKCLLRGKSAILSVGWNISLYSKNHCVAILIGFGDT